MPHGPSRYLEKPIGEIVTSLSKDAQVGSKLHEEIKGALIAKATIDITTSIENHLKASNKLSNRILWLNIILGVFTVVGAVLAFVQVLK